MTRVAIRHVSRYRYDRPVSLGPQLVRLRPAPHARTAITEYRLTMTPADHALAWQQDPFANWVARATFPHPVEALEVEAALTADLRPVNPFDFRIDPDAASWPFLYAAGLVDDLAPFLRVLPAGPLFEALAGGVPDRIGTVPLLVDLARTVCARIAYTVRMEAGTQAPEETLVAGSGSCRDSAWLLVQLLRRLGIAARFVSGYLVQLADGATIPADSVEFHAWAEAYVPGAGWVGLDATSGLLAAEGHIPLAATARIESAAPIEGVFHGDATACFDAALSIRRLGPIALSPR